jgi:GR25 family glycosyltransferase involved in LPS biosynthesis
MRRWLGTKRRAAEDRAAAIDRGPGAPLTPMDMKTCVFINLAEAVERRAAFEAGFAGLQAAGWMLSRFEAYGPSVAGGLAGALTPPEKGCFASHRAALTAHVEGPDPVLVAEDDVRFAPGALGMVDAMLAASDWDIVFTDVGLCDLPAMVQLAGRRASLAAQGQFLLLDLAARRYFGATAYAVRGASKAKVLAALDAAQDLDQPYDLYLRDLARRGELKMATCFPFLSTPAATADRSQIQTAATAPFDRAMTAYRRLMFLHPDLEASRREISELQAGLVTAESELVGGVFSVLASPNFPLET